MTAIQVSKVKVLILGPCETGKTVIANFLADATETSGGEYHPTQGCRILEFEQGNIEKDNKTISTEVELWDVSGDHKFEACWPAIARDTNGVVFVFNPDKLNHDKELESWHRYFVQHSNVKDAHCVAFAHDTRGKWTDDGNAPTLSGRPMSKIKVVATNVDDGGDKLRDEFSSFLSRLITSLSDKREEEELSIMNDP